VAALTSSTLSSTAVASAVRDALAENHKKYSREFEQHALSDVRKLCRGPYPSRSHSQTVVLLSYCSEFDTEPSHVYETTVRADTHLSMLSLNPSVLTLNLYAQALRAASYRAHAGLYTILQPVYRKSAASIKTNYLVGFYREV
jgi:hypothetical protein